MKNSKPTGILSFQKMTIAQLNSFESNNIRGGDQNTETDTISFTVLTSSLKCLRDTIDGTMSD